MVHRASDVITRLRAIFAKKDAASEAVDLNEAAREVIALTSSELQRSRVMLRPELAGDFPPASALRQRGRTRRADRSHGNRSLTTRSWRGGFASDGRCLGDFQGMMRYAS